MIESIPKNCRREENIKDHLLKSSDGKLPLFCSAVIRTASAIGTLMDHRRETSIQTSGASLCATMKATHQDSQIGGAYLFTMMKVTHQDSQIDRASLCAMMKGDRDPI
jgi:hypothetical protein